MAASFYLLPGVFPVTSYGATGDGVTDDTAAIQAAIDACWDSGGGTVYFPPGVYYLGTAPYGWGAGFSTEKAILHLPSPTGSVGDPAIAITLAGPCTPPDIFWGAGLGTYTDNAGARLTTDQADSAGSGAAGMIGVAASDSSEYNGGATGFFAAISVEIKDLGLTCYPNPEISGIRLERALNCRLSGISVSCNTLTGSAPPEPTHTASVGIKTPNYNGAARTTLTDCQAEGFYTGMVLQDCSTCNNIFVLYCIRGIFATCTNVGSTIQFLLTQTCKDHLVLDQTTSVISIDVGMHYTETMDATQSGLAWIGASPNSLLDAGNKGKGRISYRGIHGDGYVISGASNLTLLSCQN